MNDRSSEPGSTLHPSAATLSAFANGHTLSLDEVESIEAHLHECDCCAARLANVPPDASVTRIAELAAGTVPAPKLTPGYELIEELGRGSSGVVYRAVQPGLGREVALKVLVHGANASERELARFRNEAAILARLSHNNIIRVFDQGEQDGVPFVALELIEGPTLGNWLDEHGLPDPRSAARLVAQLADALHAAHAEGVTHRDLKPANVLLGQAGDSENGVPLGADKAWRPVLTDFGLARLNEVSMGTASGHVLGTPAWLPPEVLLGRRERDNGKADIYGLGAILYQCLGGRPPYVGETTAEIIAAASRTEPPSLRTLRPGIPRDLAVICHRCLDRNPARRFDSSADLRDELQRFLDGVPIRSRPLRRVEAVLRWVKRNPWQATTAVAVALSILVGIAGLEFNRQSIVDERDAARRNYREARETVWGMVDALSERSIFEIPERRKLLTRQAELACDMFTKLVAVERTPEARVDLARIQMLLGSIQIAEGDSRGAQGLLESAGEGLADVIGEGADVEVLRHLVAAQNKLVLALDNQGQHEQALGIADATIKVVKDVLASRPESHALLLDLAWLSHNRATCLVSLGRHREARGGFTAAIEMREQVADEETRQGRPANPALALGIAESHSSAGCCDLAEGDLDRATRHFRKALDSLRALVVDGYEPERSRVSFATNCLNLGNVLAATDNPTEAIHVTEEGLGQIRQLLAIDSGNGEVRSMGAMLAANLAMYLGAVQKDEAAADSWIQAASWAVDPAIRDYCRVMRVCAEIKQDELDLAADLIDALAEQKLTDDNQFFLAAAVDRLLVRLMKQSTSAEDADGNSSEPRFAPLAALEVSLIGELTERGWFQQHAEYGATLHGTDDESEFVYFRQTMGATGLDTVTDENARR